MLIKNCGYIVLCMAMSFYGLISERAGEMTCLLLPFLPHIAFYKSGDQLLKISKPRGGEMQAALLLKYVEQSKDSYLTCLVSNPGSRNTRPFGAFASSMVTPVLCTAYGTTFIHSAMSKPPTEVLWCMRD